MKVQNSRKINQYIYTQVIPVLNIVRKETSRDRAVFFGDARKQNPNIHMFLRICLDTLLLHNINCN